MLNDMHALLSLLFAINIGPAGAGIEYRQPQLAATQQMVAVTFGAGTSVYFSSSRDQGRTFSAPVKVAEAPLLALNIAPAQRLQRRQIQPAAVVMQDDGFFD